MSEIWNLNTLCRCCHADGSYKSLNLEYHTENGVEIYENMLTDTFGISISSPPLEASYSICDFCIQSLRAAQKFKHQVMSCEQKFHVYCANELVGKFNDVKIEADYGDYEADDVDYKPEMDNDSVGNGDKYNIEEDVENEMKVTNEEDNVEEDVENEIKVTNEDDNKQNMEELPQIEEREKQKMITLEDINAEEKDSDTVYICKYCDAVYNNKNTLMHHVKKQHKNRMFKCNHCEQTFVDIKKYLKHLRSHPPSYECQVCQKKFYTRQNRAQHISKMHRNKKTGQVNYNCYNKFQCDICQKFFVTKSSLVRHLKWHNGTIKNKLCDLCGNSFNDVTNLKKHIQSVHEKLRPFICTFCNKRYSTKKSLKEHMLKHLVKHTSPDKMTCNKCEKQFLHLKSYKRHVLAHENQFLCRYCPLIFDDKASRNMHRINAHNNGQMYNCSICGHSFLHKYSLNRHMDGHNNVKRYSCATCGQKFNQKHMLERHFRRNHKEKIKTKCEICKRNFVHIEKHVANHNKIKKFTCEYCGKAFLLNNALNRHKLEKHFGRTFDCDLCDKRYEKKRSLQVHKMKVHQDNVVDKLEIEIKVVDHD